MTQKSFESSLQEKPNLENEEHIVTTTLDQVTAGRRSEESRQRLEWLANLPDDEIDTEAIPKLSEAAWKTGVRGIRPVTKQEVTLWLDDEVLPWFESLNQRSFRMVNHILRREMQRRQQEDALQRETEAS